MRSISVSIELCCAESELNARAFALARKKIIARARFPESASQRAHRALNEIIENRVDALFL
jgi:hypothetical protein